MSRTFRLALSAQFVAVMMILGYIESLMPVGTLPGIKLGLSNSVLLLSLYWLGIPVSFRLMLAKVFLSGFLFGNPQTIQYSLAGGVLSMAAMSLAIFGLRGVEPVGAGVAGAVMHNVGQVLLAMAVLRTAGLLYYMGVLMLAGIAMGMATGTAAGILMRRLPPGLRPQIRPGGLSGPGPAQAASEGIKALPEAAPKKPGQRQAQQKADSSLSQGHAEHGLGQGQPG